MRIGILAGELSGDALGAGLIRALRERIPNLQVEGIGGPQMTALGCRNLAEQERLAVMGFVDPLKRLPELLGIRRRVYRYFRDHPPDLFLGIDSPAFNIPLERRLRKAGVRTAHYVSPQIWAWRQERVHKIARSVDLMLSLFPFEARFYRDHRVPVAFVGHYLADRIPLEPDPASARRTLGLDESARIVALLPGSRGKEVALLAPTFIEAARRCLERDPDLQFVIPAANDARYQQLRTLLRRHADLPVQLVAGRAHQAMGAADAVLLASGTTTLEALLLKRPMVVAYKFPVLSYAIYSRLLRIPYVALPNILAGRELVPELLQDRATPEALADAVAGWLEQPERTAALREAYVQIHRELRQNADDKAAEAVLGLVTQEKGPNYAGAG